ncbi:MAG: BREX system P-loop protein BrxC [Spirosomataceae bacterium]
MQLRALYERKIDREINPAVVVSNKKADTIAAEINEYIFTDELLEKLYNLLDTVINKRTGKTGIWINGYYGSGKSHFIKYAHYCLDSVTSEQAFEHLLQAVDSYDTTKKGSKEEITPSNLMLLKKKIQASQCDNIMFNVEDETDDSSGERLTRIFLKMFNKFRGYNANDIPLALLLEKYLDKKGKFEEFKALVATELGYTWQYDAAQAASFELDGLLTLAHRLVPELDTVSLHGKLSSPETFNIGINDTLIPELKEYLKTKDPHYRLLFLVDEVSQYIGANKALLLNFQNIVERVSEDCNNQVWIACTAQQTLDEVSGGVDGMVDIHDEFGKILGRFDTRLSLQSNDAALITQKRVLGKNSDGIKALSQLYYNNKDYIQNQFKISHELYKGYQSEDDFILAYPFVPYQFKLIAHVFEAFQQLRFVIKEVKDNERSVLGITHYTAKKSAAQEVGVFLPFDAFFNEQFHTNLTQQGNRAIQNGLEFTKNDAFAQRVVKSLFMISNLLENQRQTFPSNLDNLTVLMMTELDQNKMQLQRQIKEVIGKLIEGNIIREEKGSYFFFNEDEIDVQNLIRSQPINNDFRFEQFDGFFRKMTNLSPKVSFGANDFKVGYSVEGKEVFRGGNFEIKVLWTDEKPLIDQATNVRKADLVVGINEWFRTDGVLRKDFERYCKTLLFFRNNSSSSTGERAKTIENFSIRNNALSESIKSRLVHRFAETRFISQQLIIEPDQVRGTTPTERLKNAIEKHLDGLYKNHKLSEPYAQTQAALKQSAAKPIQKDMDLMLTPAEKVVNDVIGQHNDQMTVLDLVSYFDKAPFGWRTEAVLDVLVHLVQKRKREFRYRNQPRYPIIDFINKAVSMAEQAVCEVVSGQEIDQATLDQVIISFKTIFNAELLASTDGATLLESLQIELEKYTKLYAPFEESYFGAYPFGLCFHEAMKQLKAWAAIRDPKQLFKVINDHPETGRDLFDKAAGMRDFASQHCSDYDAIKKFYEANIENFRELAPVHQDKADSIATFLRMDDPRREYRHIRKAYDELKHALHGFLKDLTNEVVALYETIFEELATEAKQQGITEGNVYASQEAVIQQIKTLQAITPLQNKKLDAANFKSEELTKIIQFAASKTPTTAAQPKVGEPELYYITKVRATISTSTELEQYLAKVREDMLKLLANHKTIVIK